MKAWFKGFVVCSILSGGVFSLTIYLDKHGFFDLKELNISFVESEQASQFPAMQRWKQDLKQDFSSLKDTSLWDLPISDIAAKLVPLAWLENYNLRRRFPNQLSIELKPKKWVALLQTSSSRNFKGLSSSCDVLPELKLLDSIDLPVIFIKDIEQPVAKQKICEFLNLLQGESALISENISSIRWTKEGLQVQLMEPAVQLNLGLSELDTRIKRIEKVLRNLEYRSLTPKVITASFGQKVVVKLRKDR